jgi:hypothetical protein
VKLHHGRGCSHWMMLLASNRGCFGSLRVLALNFCGLTSFSSLVALESELPLVEELYVAANQFADISPLGNAGSFFVFTKVDCHYSINYLHPSLPPSIFSLLTPPLFLISHTRLQPPPSSHPSASWTFPPADLPRGPTYALLSASSPTCRSCCWIATPLRPWLRRWRGSLLS